MNIKFLRHIFSAITLLFACSQTSNPNDADQPGIIQTDSNAIASKLLTLSYAERIMGEPGKLTGNTFSTKVDTLEYKCDYTAIAEDVVTHKTGKLYFMYEVYANVAAAKHAYTAIYEANRGNQGVEVVPGLADEAYYHTDGRNFYFFLVRKGEKMFRMKVNKVTIHSSEKEFKEVTKRIADSDISSRSFTAADSLCLGELKPNQSCIQPRLKPEGYSRAVVMLLPDASTHVALPSMCPQSIRRPHSTCTTDAVAELRAPLRTAVGLRGHRSVSLDPRQSHFRMRDRRSPCTIRHELKGEIVVKTDVASSNRQGSNLICASRGRWGQ